MAELLVRIAITMLRLLAGLLTLLGDWVEADWLLSNGWFSAKLWIALRDKFQRRFTTGGRV